MSKRKRGRRVKTAEELIAENAVYAFDCPTCGRPAGQRCAANPTTFIHLLRRQAADPKYDPYRHRGAA